jgi:hypothetical protein
LEHAVTIVFNSAQVYIIDYPANDAVEIFDKRSGRTGLIQGAVAARFRREFSDFMEATPDEDKFEDFIGPYSTLLNQQATMH